MGVCSWYGFQLPLRGPFPLPQSRGPPFLRRHPYLLPPLSFRPGTLVRLRSQHVSAPHAPFRRGYPLYPLLICSKISSSISYSLLILALAGVPAVPLLILPTGLLLPAVCVPNITADVPADSGIPMTTISTGTLSVRGTDTPYTAIRYAS